MLFFVQMLRLAVLTALKMLSNLWYLSINKKNERKRNSERSSASAFGHSLSLFLLLLPPISLLDPSCPPFLPSLSLAFGPVAPASPVTEQTCDAANRLYGRGNEGNKRKLVFLFRWQ
jgi:hypothetical protein